MQTETQISSSANTTAVLNVLFVGQRPVSDCLQALLQSNHYTWESIEIDCLAATIESKHIVGTVVVDNSLIAPKDIPEYQRLFETIDARNISLILYNAPKELSLEAMSLASLAESAELNELWARIECNVKSQQCLHQNRPQENKGSTEPKVSEELQRQLEMAGHVQRNFLPSHLPNTHKCQWATVFRPADWVSGDIYDIARLDETHVGFYLADAVGHSMPAALLTMFLKQATVMRQTFEDDYTIFQPQQVIQTLNHRMSEQELAGCLFATAFYGLLNIETFELKFCRAGHPYPILIRNNERTQLQSRGGLLGVFPDAEFQQESIQLQPGDKLFIYSDGGEPLIGQNKNDELFEYTKIFQSISKLSIEKMLAAFNQLAEEYHFGPGETDDVSAIGLEIL